MVPEFPISLEHFPAISAGKGDSLVDSGHMIFQTGDVSELGLAFITVISLAFVRNPDMRQKMAFFGVCLVALGTFEAHSFHIAGVFEIFQSSDKLVDL